MTRYTNLFRKRTYVQAGFNDPNATATAASKADRIDEEPSTSGTASAPPEKKKQKKTAKEQANSQAETGSDMGGETSVRGDASGEGENNQTEATTSATATKSLKKKKKIEKHIAFLKKSEEKRKAASESRRVKRINHRHAETTCLACREKGHKAADCPNNRGANGNKAKPAVGICYRCGSNKHNLARCKEPVDPDSPLPYASCFVCNGTGHLASTCPQNASKGVYPNGGSCKLCGQVTHLAKNCDLRKNDARKDTGLVGTGVEAGADEDDFHTLSHKRKEVDKDERNELRAKRRADVKVGALSGTVRTFGSASKPAKKVVTF